MSNKVWDPPLLHAEPLISFMFLDLHLWTCELRPQAVSRVQI